MKTQIQLARGGRYLPLSFFIFVRLAIGSRSSILASFCGVVLVGLELGHSASSDSSQQNAMVDILLPGSCFAG